MLTVGKNLHASGGQSIIIDDFGSLISPVFCIFVEVPHSVYPDLIEPQHLNLSRVESAVQGVYRAPPD